MKKFIFFLLIVFVASNVNAQRIDASKVPAAVKASFAKQFPSMTSNKWDMEDGDYEANFTQDEKAMSAVFSANGTFKESEVDINISELPAGILDYVKAHYNGKKATEAAKVTKANGTVNYEAEVNGKDVIFDSNGKYLREEKD